MVWMVQLTVQKLALLELVALLVTFLLINDDKQLTNKSTCIS